GCADQGASAIEPAGCQRDGEFGRSRVDGSPAGGFMTERSRVERPPLEEAVPADLFKAEVRAWARRIGVEPTSITIRPMRRKWASCSSQGRLTFSLDLLRQPASF